MEAVFPGGKLSYDQNKLFESWSIWRRSTDMDGQSQIVVW